MALYWPAFEFSFGLDASRLLPFIAAIESCKAAASTAILPPQWRAGESSAVLQASLREQAEASGEPVDEIQLRKHAMALTLATKSQAWVRLRFAPGCALITLDDILSMHSMVAEEAGVRYSSAGIMRQEGQAVITGTATIGIHVGAPAPRLPRLMHEYIQFVNGAMLNSLPPIIHALVAHFFITTIHPFSDGNGRVSRLVSAAILFQRGYNGHGFYAPSNYFYENEERYHRILFGLQQEPCPDLTEFIAFGMEGLALELRGINNFIKVKINRIAARDELPLPRWRRALNSAESSAQL